MAVQGDRVQSQHVAHQVDQLAGMTDRARPLQPQRVVEGPVDGLDVGTSGVEPAVVVVAGGMGLRCSVGLKPRRRSSSAWSRRTLTAPPPEDSGTSNSPYQR